MEFINTYIKYLYYLLGLVIIVFVVLLTIKLIELVNRLKKVAKRFDSINDKINAINEKVEYLQQSFSTSWAFFIKIAAVITILKMIREDYKATPKQKRSLRKSVVRGCMRGSPKFSSFVRTR